MMIVALAGAVATGAACSSNSPSPSHPTTTAAATTTAATSAATPTHANTAPSNNSGGPANNGNHNAPATNPNPGPNNNSNQSDKGADGSTGNNLSKQYCAQNQDPGCPAGSYVGPNAIPNPNGDNNYVPCEGTICTNPDHGAGTDPQQNGGDQGADQGQVAGAPCEGDGKWVHLDGGNAAHYGTDWMCQH